VRFFHGTALVSAERIVTGEGLSAATAAGGKIDGEPGFFLATYDRRPSSSPLEEHLARLLS
jgi:hypothetical protein